MSDKPASSGAPVTKPPPWNDPFVRSIFFQILALAFLAFFSILFLITLLQIWQRAVSRLVLHFLTVKQGLAS
jgi:ABC-type amino acid transport system permease subunit